MRMPTATKNGVIVDCSGSGPMTAPAASPAAAAKALSELPERPSSSPSTLASAASCSTSHKGRGLRIGGSQLKLPCGGGEVVAHSSVQARHGLSPAASPERALCTRL